MTLMCFKQGSDTVRFAVWKDHAGCQPESKGGNRKTRLWEQSSRETQGAGTGEVTVEVRR